MSQEIKRRPILYRGEAYAKPITKSSSGGAKKMRFTYEEARESFLRDISEAKEGIRNLPERLRMPNEIILSLRLHPEFSAKSYYPSTLFDGNSKKFGLVEIGSRIWRREVPEAPLPDNKEAKPETSKLFFVRATKESLNKIENQLQKRELSLTKGFKNDIRKVSSFGFLPAQDQIVDLPEGWHGSELEAVLHPFDIDQEQVLNRFFERLDMAGVSLDSVKYKQYPSGVSFVNFKGDQHTLDFLKRYNPLRTVHPIMLRSLPDFPRSKGKSSGPKPPVFKQKPEVIVGVLDGGLDVNNPYTKNYSEGELSVEGDALPEFEQHGTMGSTFYRLFKYSYPVQENSLISLY